MANSYNLSQLHGLLAFADLPMSDYEYIQQSDNKPSITLSVAAAYTLTAEQQILFTGKLRYYCKAVEREVNRHINRLADTSVIEGKMDEYVAKFLWKSSREAIETLGNEANCILADTDPSGQLWTHITVDSESYPVEEKAAEKVVFLHYVMAELARCWLELQELYAGVTGCTSYDVSLFYTAILHRQPDKALALKRTTPGKPKLKPTRTDGCFLYDNKDNFAMDIQQFTNKLKKYNLIADDMDYKKMMALFSGESCRYTYQWMGDNHILTYIIKGLCSDEKPILQVWPEGASKWKTVSYRFVDKDGKPMPDISKEHSRKKSQSIVNEIIDVFKSSC